MHGHANVECKQRPSLECVGHVLGSTSQLDEPRLYVVDPPLCIPPALPPLQDASALVLELSLVGRRGVELLRQNSARVIGLHGSEAFR
ncbi:MAG TPA: hypothetical protein VKV73_11140 [Chloroflexota bacterium]|nr:hypothetical protein [Chloroflexota bacterium]